MFEVGGKIREDYPHRFIDGKLCLATRSDIFYKCKGDVTVDNLINSFVIPYLFSYRYYERYNEYPFGERKHGSFGIFQAWLDMFNVTRLEDAIGVVVHTVEHPYRGHLPCYCQSGKKRRNCHPVSKDVLVSLENPYFKNILLDRLELFRYEVKRYQQNRENTK